MDIIELLEGTIYEPDAECIDRVFKRKGIVDEESFQKATALLRTTHVCGHEVYPILGELRRVLRGEPKSYTDEELAVLDAVEAADPALDEVSEEEE